MIDEEKQDEKQIAGSSDSEINESGETQEEQTPPSPQEEKSSGAEQRIKELTERVRIYEETLRALQNQKQAPEPKDEEELYIDPATKKLKEEIKTLKMALAYMYDTGDMMMVRQKYPDYTKYEPEVEAYLGNIRKQGQNLTREQVYLMVKAQKLMSQSQQKPQSKPKTEEKSAPPPETKSTKKAVNQPLTLEDLQKKIENIKF